MAQKKERLDKLLVSRGLVPTRAKSQGLIMAGEVYVDGARVDKAGTAVSLDAHIELKTPMPYVGRGGFKLAGALTQFGISVAGAVCADVGACTGGFTDALLQHGAARVYAIDVGYGQLDWKLRQDKRVVTLERTNARYLESLPEPVSFVCMDVSFISVRLILPAVRGWLTADGQVVALIKPQFEAGPQQVGKGGVVKETAVHRQVLLETIAWCQANGYVPAGLMRSPISGSDGNVEFLLWLRLEGEPLVGETAVAETLATESAS